MGETRETLADVLRYYGVERERGVLFVPAEPGPVECATEVDAVRVLLRLADHDANVAEKELDALAERLSEAEKATTWEAGHQRRALEALDAQAGTRLAEEFPFGCDTIDHVAEALVLARRERDEAREWAQNAAVREANAEARVAALRRYGQHEDGCCHEVSRFCDCGLDVLLSAAPVPVPVPGKLDESDQTAVDCWEYWHEYAKAMHEDTLAADGLPRSDAIWECGRAGWLLSVLDAMRAVQPEAAQGETPGLEWLKAELGQLMRGAAPVPATPDPRGEAQKRWDAWVDPLSGAVPAPEPAPETGADEPRYPCDRCGKLRTKAEGGTTFTVCDECWDATERKSGRAAPTRREDGRIETEPGERRVLRQVYYWLRSGQPAAAEKLLRSVLLAIDGSVPPAPTQREEAAVLYEDMERRRFDGSQREAPGAEGDPMREDAVAVLHAADDAYDGWAPNAEPESEREVFVAGYLSARLRYGAAPTVPAQLDGAGFLGVLERARQGDPDAIARIEAFEAAERAGLYGKAPVQPDGDWWCPECNVLVDARCVTNDERHDACGTAVEWRPVQPDPSVRTDGSPSGSATGAHAGAETGTQREGEGQREVGE